MTDRELLELAAKAAAYEIDFDEPVNGWYVNGYDENGDPAAWWNPLTDDGDALRLAVKLGLEVSMGAKARDPETKEQFDITMVTGGDAFKTEHHNDDPCAATRRAIVRAAAEIGKTL